MPSSPDGCPKPASTPPGSAGRIPFAMPTPCAYSGRPSPLKAIGDLLGHTSTASTAIYLKLATEDLREIGLNVPPAREELP
jgi:integrase/recombinase XerD